MLQWGLGVGLRPWAPRSTEGRWDPVPTGQGAAGPQGALCPRPALEMPEVDLGGQLPFLRPLPHIAVLRDGLPPLFQDDYGAEEELAAEARGEHTLAEKFGERWAQPGALLSAPTWARPTATLGLGCVEQSWVLGLSGAQRGGPCTQLVPHVQAELPTGPVQARRLAPTSHLAHVGLPGLWTCPTPRLCPEGPSPDLPPVCLDDTFGPDCSLTCDDCRNGGACVLGLNGCDCPKGWTGLVCNESEAARSGGWQESMSPRLLFTPSCLWAGGQGPLAHHTLIHSASVNCPLCQVLYWAPQVQAATSADVTVHSEGSSDKQTGECV